MEDRVRQEFADLSVLFSSCAALAPDIISAARILAASLSSGSRVFFCGNGGSAADAQHLAAELVVRLRPDSTRPALPGIALTTDSSVLTACANDFGFETIFSRQLEALACKGDALVALSTSGNSPNIVRALECAAGKAIPSVFLTGNGPLPSLTGDICHIRVPASQCNRIQEVQIAIGHLLIAIVEKMVYGTD